MYDTKVTDIEFQQVRRSIPIYGKPSATIGTMATRSTDGMPVQRMDSMTAREWYIQALQCYSVVNRLMGFAPSAD